MTSRMSTRAASLPVVFRTQTPYPLPSQKFMIPMIWKRYQLSQLINKALFLPNPVPFDFLLRGEVLRSNVGEWCADHSVGEEETLEIEYIVSVMPPQRISHFKHDDWVSSVSCKVQSYFLTASYDGHIRAFDYSKRNTCTTLVHAAPITSICVVPSSKPSDHHIIASASHDLTAHLTQISLASGRPSTVATKSTLLATLQFHTAPLSSVASNITGTHLLTTSWDSLICLWDTVIPSTDTIHEPSFEEERKKRRRIGEGVSSQKKAPVSVFKSHSARVSKAVFGSWSQDQKGYSCGFDSTLRSWDVENGLCIQTIAVSEKPFLDLIVMDDERNLLASSTDRTMTLYDLRIGSSATATAVASFFHMATPSCLALGAIGTQQVVTGAYDGVVRLWDLRSTKSAISGFKAWDGMKKVLSVDWVNGVVGVGGEGGLEVWKIEQEKLSDTRDMQDEILVSAAHLPSPRHSTI